MPISGEARAPFPVSDSIEVIIDGIGDFRALPATDCFWGLGLCPRVKSLGHGLCDFLNDRFHGHEEVGEAFGYHPRHLVSDGGSPNSEHLTGVIQGGHG